MREVKERERQHRFRNDLLEMQGSVCAFCDFDVPVALEAAHIVPKQENGTDDPRNGLLLCSVHHRIFDTNCLGMESRWPRFSATSRMALRAPANFASLTFPPPFSPHMEALRWRWGRFRLGPEAPSQNL